MHTIFWNRAGELGNDREVRKFNVMFLEAAPRENVGGSIQRSISRPARPFRKAEDVPGTKIVDIVFQPASCSLTCQIPSTPYFPPAEA